MENLKQASGQAQVRPPKIVTKILCCVALVYDSYIFFRTAVLRNLCISQFQLRPAPPRATAGHLPALSVPGVGHLQILCCPGAGHLPTPGPFLSFWHARGFLSENNYTEDFTGKESRLAHLSRTGKIEEVCKGMFLILCMHFFIAYRARIT